MEAAFLVWVVHCIQLFPSLTIFAYLNWLDGACPSVHICLVRLIGHWFDVHISDCILCHLQSEAKTFLPILNFWPGLVS